MKIRAITGFFDPGWPLQEDRLAALAASLKDFRLALQAEGYEVQTLRLAGPPPARMQPPLAPKDRPKMARELGVLSAVLGVDYISLGPTLPGDNDGFAVIPEVLAACESAFASGVFADAEEGLSLEAARACAKVIHQAAALSQDGFANLRFAALANVGPGAPFFPAAYHDGGPPAVALATEGADLAVEALQGAASLGEAKRGLVNEIERHAQAMARTGGQIAAKHDLCFLGIDFSLAPFPEAMRSIGTALEAFGLAGVGLSGTSLAVAHLVQALEEARFPRTGFCGVMLPVLEDVALAKRAAEGHLSVGDLLLYATLCGTGLDTVPLPGDASQAQLAAVLIELGVLALRHDKPLTARLMPIPGKHAGDEVHFDFPYFADSRVMALPSQPLSGLLAGSEVLHFKPRNPRAG